MGRRDRLNGGARRVAVVGARALFRDLNRLGEDTGPLAKAFSAAGKKAVAPIAEAVRARVPVSDREDRWTNPGALAADVRSNATRTGATVRMGRARIPYAGWIDFGGTRKRPFDASREYLAGGRYLYPAPPPPSPPKRPETTTPPPRKRPSTPLRGPIQATTGVRYMTDLSHESLEPLPHEVTVTKAFSERLPSQRIIDIATKADGFTFSELANQQPFRLIAFRALVRDWPVRDATSLWMHAYDCEVIIEEVDPTPPPSTTNERFSVVSGE